MTKLPLARRRALWLLGAGFALPSAALAEERAARVGYLSWQAEGPHFEATFKAFAEGLRSEGFVEGRNLELLLRAANGDAKRFNRLARELAAAKVDVFFAPATAMADAAWFASRDTPIVIASIMDPVALKFVHSLARPGTRVTGVTTLSDELILKRLQLLMEVVPGLKRVGVIIDEAMRDSCKQETSGLLQAAGQLGLSLVTVHVDRPELVDAAFGKLLDAKVQAVASTMLSTRNNLEKEYALAALKARLPSIFESELVVREGGLISYGPDYADIFRRAGQYTGRVLKGAKPAEMAMEQPRQFRFVLNLKTAKALGITIPQSLRLRADEVIE